MRAAAAVLPPGISRLFGVPLAFIYSLLPLSLIRRTSVNRHLGLICGASGTKREVRRMARQSLRNSVSAFIDDIIIDKLDREYLLKRGVVKGIGNLEDALSLKKGVLLVGGHFTGDRVSKMLLREIGFPILSVRSGSPIGHSASLVEKKFFKPVMNKIMDKRLKDSIYIEDKGFSIEILRRLRQNGLVSILFDAITSKKGMYCSFFGSQRFFPTNFLQIAQATGAAIVPMVCVGNSRSFTIVIDRRLELQHFPDKGEFISANLSRLVKILESQILQYPTHWLLL